VVGCQLGRFAPGQIGTGKSRLGTCRRRISRLIHAVGHGYLNFYGSIVRKMLKTTLSMGEWPKDAGFSASARADLGVRSS